METTLFDAAGHAVCYIADDGENSVYLWSGHAVASVDDETVFGWNGRHLGFYVDGVMYDVYGRRVGSTAGKCAVVSCYEPVKSGKYSKYSKWEKGSVHTRPSFGWKYSDQLLLDFLLQGAVGDVVRDPG
jgi:hypothetical protein